MIETTADTDNFEIEQGKKKLFLIPVEYGRKRLYSKENVYATVNARYGMLCLGKMALTAMGMQNCWYKMAYDSDKFTIAWTVKSNLEKGEMESKAWKLCKASKVSGGALISISRILDTFKGLEKRSYPKLKIKKYKDHKSILDDATYYYVTLEV